MHVLFKIDINVINNFYFCHQNIAKGCVETNMIIYFKETMIIIQLVLVNTIITHLLHCSVFWGNFFGLLLVL